MIFYKYARALVQTEFMINEIHKLGIGASQVAPPNPDTLEAKQSEELRALTAHRMSILSEISGALGYKLVPHDQLRF